MKLRVQLPEKPAKVVDVDSESSISALLAAVDTPFQPCIISLGASISSVTVTEPDVTLASVGIVPRSAVRVTWANTAESNLTAGAGAGAGAATGITTGPTATSEREPASMQRVVMPDDNSCMFRSLAWLILGDAGLAADVREMAAASIAENTDLAAMLERPVPEYCAWLRKPTSWGGEVELATLSTVMDVQIVAWNVESNSCLQYGSSSRRVHVMYTGIHYDALAIGSPKQAANQDAEMQRVFTSGADDLDMAGAQSIVQTAHSKKEFTNTATFTLKCTACGMQLVGETGAQEHAEKTGHTSFTQSE